MASENLNRVFIKAYGKGKPASPVPAPASSAAPQEEWIVRIDTATAQSSVVPQMHNQRPPRHEVAMAIPRHWPAPGSGQQMMSLEAKMGHEMPTEAHVANALNSSLPAASPSPFVGDFSDFFGGTTMIVPQASLGGSNSTQLGSDQANAGQSVPLPAASGQPNPIQSIKKDEAPVFQPSQDLKSSSSVHEGPALASGEEPTDLHEPVLFDPIVLEQQIAAKNQHGEIFRLDRPSYAAVQQATEAFAEEQASSPSDASSLNALPLVADIQAAQSRPTPLPIKGPTSSDAHRRKDSGSKKSPIADEHVIAKERDLRRARVRIFNPLWEVDRLEWPRICVELLNTIDSQTPGVANNLLNACQEGLQVLAVTSPQSGAGTSTVACCLAMIAGRHGLKIALVDGNMENPSLCYQTNLELDVDWHEAIARKLPLEEIAVHSVDDQITLVPLLARLSAPQLNEHNMAKMLNELSQSFDLVVVDLGHMSSTRNMVTTLGDLGALNAVVAVVDRRTSSAERIESCLRQIRQTGIASVGLVENFAA